MTSKLTSSALSPNASGYARWCFLTDKKRWKSMGPVSRVLEGVFSQQPRPSSFTISSGGQTYLIDFVTMKQKNKRTNFVREIQRQFICAQTGAVTIATPNNAPLLLLPAPASALIAANSAVATATTSSAKTSSAASRKPPSKSAARVLQRAATRNEMREDTKKSYEKIVGSLKNLPVDIQHRALARVVLELLKPSKIKHAAAALDEVTDLKVKLEARQSRRWDRACRHQLALNLAREMIGSTGGPQW
jgi:hypothetical protein